MDYTVCVGGEGLHKVACSRSAFFVQFRKQKLVSSRMPKANPKKKEDLSEVQLFLWHLIL